MTVSTVTSPEHLATLILSHLDRVAPYKPTHILAQDELDQPSTHRHTVFRGSFDWHSSVHSHWALLRIAAVVRQRDTVTPDASDLLTRIDGALTESFSAERIERELDELDRPHRLGFELPYGMAWLLTLGAELTPTDSYASALRPLLELARARFHRWLEIVPGPIRSGQHSQSAFAMSLVLDAARTTDDAELEQRVVERALAFYEDDSDAPIAWEPSAYDFLSPALAEADLMRRVLGDDFAPWLDRFLPTIELTAEPAVDQSDGKLAHRDGLCLSRAWMLSALAKTRPALEPLAEEHRQVGLRSMQSATYAGTHWLPSFAVYLIHGSAGAAR